LKLKGKTWLVLVGLGVAAAGVALAITRNSRRPSPASTLGATYTVARGDVVRSIVAYGTVVPKQEYTFTLPGASSGNSW